MPKGSRRTGIYGTGAHEAYHQVEGLMGDKQNISMYAYSNNVVKSVYEKWAANHANKSSGNIKTDFSKNVSPYAKYVLT